MELVCKGGIVMKLLLVLNFIIPFVMLLVGGILRKNPVWDMKSHNGYNTPSSRKSQKHWDYAQSIAPQIFIEKGKILLAIEMVGVIVCILFQIPVAVANILGLIIGFGFLFYTFMIIDRKIKKEIGV